MNFLPNSTVNILLSALMVHFMSYGQEVFTAKAGFSLFVSGQSAYKESGSFYPALTIGPELRLMGSESVSLSVSAPISLGVMWSGFLNNDDDCCSNSDDGNYFAFGYDLPLMMNLNLGKVAVSKQKKGFGVVLGYGLSHHRSFSYVHNKVDDTQSKSLIRFSGQMVHVGLVFNETIFRISYMNNQNYEGRPYVVSLGILFMMKE